MREVLVVIVGALAVLALLLAAAAVTGVALTVRSLRRANRVVPDRRCSAPTAWLWSYREPARLHRRLRRAAAVAQASVAPLRPARRTRRGAEPSSSLVSVADDLCRRVVTLDDQLIGAVASTHRPRRSLLAPLAAEVHELEVAAARLSQLAATWQRQLRHATSSQGPTLDLGRRMDAFAAAMTELSGPGSTG